MQERRTVMLPTSTYEQLSLLQARTRLLMNDKGVDYLLSKTAMTNVLEAVIRDMTPERLAELLN
jgi:hypothetical protein